MYKNEIYKIAFSSKPRYKIRDLGMLYKNQRNVVSELDNEDRVNAINAKHLIKKAIIPTVATVAGLSLLKNKNNREKIKEVARRAASHLPHDYKEGFKEALNNVKNDSDIMDSYHFFRDYTKEHSKAIIPTLGATVLGIGGMNAAVGAHMEHKYRRDKAFDMHYKDDAGAKTLAKKFGPKVAEKYIARKEWDKAHVKTASEEGIAYGYR